MASKSNRFLSTFLFIAMTLNSPAPTTSQNECPYPCYPPPTGAGNSPPATPTPPSQTGSYPPPAFDSPPSPTGYLPNYPPPPYSADGAPSPPDAIVPWFPYYYRKPPHLSDESSSTALQGSSMTEIVTVIIFLFYNFLFLV